MRAQEINRRIEAAGGSIVRQVGSHRRYKVVDADGREWYTTVPQHRGDVPAGTVAAIARDLAPVLGKGWLK